MFLHRAMRYYRLWIYSCNVVLLVSAVAFVSVAAWVASDFRMALFPALDLRHPSLLYAYLALLLQGGVLQAIGCAGALRMSERLLHAYWALMLLLLCGDAVLGAIWLVRFQHINGEMKEHLKVQLRQHYGLDAQYQILWDRVQSESKCCGVDGPQDYATSEWLKQEGHERKQLVPRSCCRLKPGPHYEEDVPLNISCVETDRDPQLIHPSGCYEAVHRWLQHGADILCVLGFCVLAFLKLCFLGILRYEIREMIQKIRVLRDMSESPGLMDPTGPASLLPGPAMAARLKRQRSAEPPTKPNGNNNEATAPQVSTTEEEKKSSV